MALAQWPAANSEVWPIGRIKIDPRNTRLHDEGQIEAIRASIREFGVTFPALVRESGVLIAGEGRVTAAKAEGLIEFPVVVARGWTEAQCRAYSIADNRLTDLSSFDATKLRIELSGLKAEGFDLDLTGFSDDALDAALAGGGLDRALSGSLADRFGVPPFSVLNAREGWWQERKRAWIDLGIRSELGRGAPIGVAPMPIDSAKANATASFRDQDKLNAIQAQKRKGNAAPGGSPLPAADYSKSKARGDGRGRPVN